MWTSAQEKQGLSCWPAAMIGLWWFGISTNRFPLWPWKDTRIVIGKLLSHFGLIVFGISEGVWCAKYTPDGNSCFSCSPDKTVRMWDARTGKETHRFGPHTDHLYWVCFDPIRKVIATSGAGNTIKVWDPRAKKGLFSLVGTLKQKIWDFSMKKKGQNKIVYSGAYTSDGERFITSEFDGVISIYNAKDYKLITSTNPIPGVRVC